MTDQPADPLLTEDDDRPEMARFSISVDPEDKEDLENLAWYWSERRRLRAKAGKWKLSTVCRRLIAQQLVALWAQMGITGKTPEARMAELEDKMAELAKKHGGTFRRRVKKKDQQ